MIVVLFSREEITVTQSEANAIDDMIDADVKWIKIGEYRVRPSAIALIKPGGHVEPEYNLLPEQRVENRGETSASRDIIAKGRKEGLSFKEIAARHK